VGGCGEEDDLNAETQRAQRNRREEHDSYKELMKFLR
jgi:hypothetical protein